MRLFNLNSSEEETWSGIDIPTFLWLAAGFVIFLPIDDKGGVGKSFIAQIVAATIRYFNYKCTMIDTDFSNSSTAQIDGEASMLNLDERVQTGVLINLVRSLAAGEDRHAVIDVGAREEGKIRKILPWLNTIVRKAGGRIVVIRPITLGSHNQRNASNFMDLASELKIPVVFVCNEGQGRQPDYFDRWKSTNTCLTALNKGAVQTFITDADVRYVDEAVGLGLSMLDVATGDFTKLEFNEELDPDADEDTKQAYEKRRADAAIDMQAADEFFNDDVIAFVNEWLRFNIANLGAAIQDSIDKRDRLDEPESVPEVDETAQAASKPRKRRP